MDNFNPVFRNEYKYLVSAGQIAMLKARADAEGRRIFFISAREGEGLEALLAELWKLRDDLDRHAPLVSFVEEEEESEEFPEIEVEWVRE